MTKIALLFPGQGSQHVGMGRDFLEQAAGARAVFQGGHRVLGIDLTRLCLEGPENALTLTANAQPAILVVSIAALTAFRAEGVPFHFVAGHSLGEYSALVAAASLHFDDAIRTVRKRGEFMQEAVPAGIGAMAAILGLDQQTVFDLCEEAGEYGLVEVANLNGPGQVVIAGEARAVERAMELSRVRGAKRAMRLQVSAPFHSSLMSPVGDRLREVLKTVPLRDLEVPLVSNVDADVITKGDQVADALVRQVSSPVRWEEVVRRLVREGVTCFVELGPGRVLTGLVRRIAVEATAVHAEDIASLRKAVGEVKAACG
jgi:[acyl-carrier-protein] S-malonyltransferase